MSRHLMHVTSCEVSRDPQANSANHQRMIDALQAEIAADGWAGVTVTRLETISGFSFLTIEPGDQPLTLETLRAAKERLRPGARRPMRPDGQLPLAG